MFNFNEKLNKIKISKQKQPLVKLYLGFVNAKINICILKRLIFTSMVELFHSYFKFLLDMLVLRRE